MGVVAILAAVGLCGLIYYMEQVQTENLNPVVVILCILLVSLTIIGVAQSAAAYIRWCVTIPTSSSSMTVPECDMSVSLDMSMWQKSSPAA